MHLLDPSGDLAGHPGGLLVTFSGVDATLERPIHTAHFYPAEEIAWL